MLTRQRALEVITYGLFHAGDVWAREDLDPRFVGQWHLSHSAEFTATALDAAKEALSSNAIMVDIHPNLGRTNDEIRQYLKLFVSDVGNRHRSGIALRDTALRMATEGLRSYVGNVWQLHAIDPIRVAIWHAKHPPAVTAKVTEVVRAALASPTDLTDLRWRLDCSVDETRQYLRVFLAAITSGNL
jgi:hypothetical protein